MGQHLTESEKSSIIGAFKVDANVDQICEKLGFARSTVYRVLKSYKSGKGLAESLELV